jgi:hypothetical protein
MRLQKWEITSIAGCLLLMALVLYFAVTAALMGLPEEGGTPEETWGDDEIVDDTPLEGYGYGSREPDCQTKILDTLKK